LHGTKDCNVYKIYLGKDNCCTELRTAMFIRYILERIAVAWNFVERTMFIR